MKAVSYLLLAGCTISNFALIGNYFAVTSDTPVNVETSELIWILFLCIAVAIVAATFFEVLKRVSKDRISLLGVIAGVQYSLLLILAAHTLVEFNYTIIGGWGNNSFADLSIIFTCAAVGTFFGLYLWAVRTKRRRDCSF